MYIYIYIYIYIYLHTHTHTPNKILCVYIYIYKHTHTIFYISELLHVSMHPHHLQLVSYKNNLGYKLNKTSKLQCLPDRYSR